MLFARPGEYKPCGIFSLEHFGLIAVTIVCIAIAIKNTYKSSKEEVKKIIKNCTIMLLFMEIFIIIFKLCTGDPRNVNNYVPLYYCSILLYAGTLSSFAKGKKNGRCIPCNRRHNRGNSIHFITNYFFTSISSTSYCEFA